MENVDNPWEQWKRSWGITELVISTALHRGIPKMNGVPARAGQRGRRVSCKTRSGKRIWRFLPAPGGVGAYSREQMARAARIPEAPAWARRRGLHILRLRPAADGSFIPPRLLSQGHPLRWAALGAPPPAVCRAACPKPGFSGDVRGLTAGRRWRGRPGYLMLRLVPGRG